MTRPLAKIIKNTGLFDALNSAEFEGIIRAITTQEFLAGTMIAHEGEVGDECYIIQHGNVQVFTTTSDGEEIVLVKLTEGEFIGEQALLPGTLGRRNASLRAYSDVRLLKIAKADFRRVLSKDNPLKEKLLRRGEKQVKDNLLRQSALFRSLQLDTPSDWYDEFTFRDRAVIFREGDLDDKLYLIISGTAGVYQEEDGKQKLMLLLGSGRTFGEQALLEKKATFGEPHCTWSAQGDSHRWARISQTLRAKARVARIYADAEKGLSACRAWLCQPVLRQILGHGLSDDRFGTDRRHNYHRLPRHWSTYL
jgi:CRP-like cAMP-binding protein